LQKRRKKSRLGHGNRSRALFYPSYPLAPPAHPAKREWMKQAAKIISLGGVCQVAYQIEQAFGFRIYSPFDWLVTPLSGVTAILEDHGARFGLDVEIIDGPLPVCKHYRTIYFHEFPRANGKFIISEQTLQACRDKLLHKYERFAAAVSGEQPVLFVRMLGHFFNPSVLPYVVDPIRIDTGALNAFCTAIACRFPELEFKILFVYQNEFTQTGIDPEKLDRRILPRLLKNTTADWNGDRREWAELFAALNIEAMRPEVTAEKERLYT
jgi:hypothetical protein